MKECLWKHPLFIAQQSRSVCSSDHSLTHLNWEKLLELNFTAGLPIPARYHALPHVINFIQLSISSDLAVPIHTLCFSKNAFFHVDSNAMVHLWVYYSLSWHIGWESPLNEDCDQAVFKRCSVPCHEISIAEQPIWFW